MNQWGTMHKVRTQYVAGLFEIRICDALKLAAVVGPRRYGADRDRLTSGEVENLRQHAIKKAREFELLGYEVEHHNTVTGDVEPISAVYS